MACSSILAGFIYYYGMQLLINLLPMLLFLLSYNSISRSYTSKDFIRYQIGAIKCKIKSTCQDCCSLAEWLTSCWDFRFELGRILAGRIAWFWSPCVLCPSVGAIVTLAAGFFFENFDVSVNLQCVHCTHCTVECMVGSTTSVNPEIPNLQSNSSSSSKTRNIVQYVAYDCMDFTVRTTLPKFGTVYSEWYHGTKWSNRDY